MCASAHEESGLLVNNAPLTERAMAGAAVRRRQWFLRSTWRHEQLSLKMMAASMSHDSWQSRESVGVQTDGAPTLVDKYVAFAAAPYAASADITQLLEPPIPDKFVAPVPAESHHHQQCLTYVESTVASR